MTILLHHEGNYQWLDGPGRVCLESIKKHNPKARLVVFTDNAPPGLPGEVIWVGEFDRLANEIGNVYKPMGLNDPMFELRALRRWFIYALFCDQQHIEEIYSQDLDVLCFCDVEKEDKKWRLGADISLPHVEGQGCFTMGTCFVRDVSHLLEFSYWVGWLFQHPESNDWKEIEQALSVNDMGLWTRFITNRKIPTNALDEIRNGSVWDANLSLVEPRWKHDEEGKSITFENGKPYGYQAGKKTRFNCLHCWGVWKDRIDELWISSLAS